MPNIPPTFEQIQADLQELCTPEEKRMLEGLADRDWEKYQDAVTEMYMQKMFKERIEGVIRSRQGHGRRKSGSHGENRHK